MIKRIPVVLGAIVAGYWLLAFAVGLAALRMRGPSDGQWWSIDLLRGPGNWLGEMVFSFLEFISGWDYARILEDEMAIFTALLIITALSIGVGVWLFAQFIITLLIRFRIVKPEMTPNKTEMPIASQRL